MDSPMKNNLKKKKPIGLRLLLNILIVLWTYRANLLYTHAGARVMIN